MLRGFVIHELQADEIRTFVGTKKRVDWVLTALEVWSRLWVTVVVGRRNFRNIKRLLLARCRNPRPVGVVMWDWLRRSRMGLAEGPPTVIT